MTRLVFARARSPWLAIVLGLVMATGGGCKRAAELAGRSRGAEPALAPAPAESGAVASATSRPAAVTASTRVAFPGAEGFGRNARGGAAGSVCIVTSRAKTGAGTLQECLDRSGPRTVVFEVSGVLEGPFEIKHGHLTIAGQSAPGGVILKGGLVCDNVYDPNDCSDVILRHLRLRGGAPDSLRLGGTHDVIVDHCSMAGAEDENVELTRTHDVTIQYSIVAEPIGEHYKWGGLLMNYSKDVMPLDFVSIHHTVFNGVAGRLPEVSCEENGDGPGKSNCRGHVLHLELVNNVLWDVSDPIWFNRCTGNNAGNDCPPTANDFSLHLNLIGNILARRRSADADAPFIEGAVWQGASRVHAADNRVLRGGASSPVIPQRGAGKNALSDITTSKTEGLLAELARSAGALPHDVMDARLSSYLLQPVDSRPPAWAHERGVDRGDLFTPGAATAHAADGDRDGMPDGWEVAHGLDPRKNDSASLALSGNPRNGVVGCTAGYTALECFLNERASAR